MKRGQSIKADLVIGESLIWRNILEDKSGKLDWNELLTLARRIKYTYFLWNNSICRTNDSLRTGWHWEKNGQFQYAQHNDEILQTILHGVESAKKEIAKLQIMIDEQSKIFGLENYWKVD